MNEGRLRIVYTKKFFNQLKKAPFEIKVAFRDRLALFIQDPLQPLLNNHPLKGKLSGRRSINVTGDWRALYSKQVGASGQEIVTFEVLGTHSELYK